MNALGRRASRGWFLGASVAALGLLSLSLVGCRTDPAEAGKPVVRVGSKLFTESIILGEITKHLADHAGARAIHRRALGDTRTVWNALLVGEVDVYCEYTGTITQEILAGRGLKTEDDIRQALSKEGPGIRMSKSLGFNDTYAIGMRKDRARALNVRTISDLRDHPELRFGFSNEYVERGDGWNSLRRFYGLPQRDVKGLAHDLAYAGLEAGTIDATELYSTDAKIRLYDLQVLEDDRKFFPPYYAVLLYRADQEERAPEIVDALLRLQGSITEAEMTGMNARVELDKVPETRVAADFLADKLNVQADVVLETLPQRIALRTLEHLKLVGISLALAILVAVPLGIVAGRRPVLGQGILALAGIVQTFPALALLAFLIAALRQIGPIPAIVALFLYSLLPIVRNTYAGLHDIPLQIRESAEALGLSPFARLYLIELPLASRSILAGIKTAAVLNVGFATLGGLIAAGGYGQPIMAGINKGDRALILEGAIPAVVMALVVQGLFEWAERFLVPKGLRLKPVE
jgi:osmoprotectant transport system permease protein